jgi:excisionase family DNA binding protein
MPGLSLREAAREAGVSKSTIFRAIQRGRLSATRDDDGNFSIEASELFRVYPPRNSAERVGDGSAGQGAPADETPVLKVEIEGLRAQLATMREVTDDMKAQRDSWQRQAETAQRLLVDQRPALRRGLFGWLKAS